MRLAYRQQWWLLHFSIERQIIWFGPFLEANYRTTFTVFIIIIFIFIISSSFNSTLFSMLSSSHFSSPTVNTLSEMRATVSDYFSKIKQNKIKSRHAHPHTHTHTHKKTQEEIFGRDTGPTLIERSWLEDRLVQISNNKATSFPNRNETLRMIQARTKGTTNSNWMKHRQF